MSKKKQSALIMSIPIKQLVVNYFLRSTVEEDRILNLAILYETGAEIKPILVRAVGSSKDGVFEVIEGRQRVRAAEAAGLVKLPCEVIRCTSQQAVVRGFVSNINPDAPLTYSRKDILKSIETMLDNKIPRIQILKLLQEHYPALAAKRYLRDGEGTYRKKRQRMALDAHKANGVSLEDAAKEYGVKLQALLKMVDRDIDPETGLAARKAGMTRRYGTIQSNVGVAVEYAIRRFLEGQETHDQCIDFMNHIVRLNGDLERLCLDKLHRMKDAIE